MKAKVKKGTVKCIERNSLRVVLLGPVGEKGYYMEKRVNVHCLNFFETGALRRAAFEHLRQRLVGKKIEFEDYKVGKDVNADIFLEKKNVGFELVLKGLAKPIRMGEKTSKYFEDLREAQRLAQEANAGIFAEGDSGAEGKLTRKERRQKQKETGPGLGLEGCRGKTLRGFVDNVNFNLSFKVWVEELGAVVEARFAWVKIPVINKEHVTKLKNWMSKNIFQRDFRFVVSNIDEDTAEIVEAEGEVLAPLLRNGWARLESEAVTEMSADFFGRLRAAQDEAQAKRLRLWKDLKKKNRGKQIKSDRWPLKKRIEVKVMEVHNGDAVTVQEPGGERLRIFLTNIRAPKYSWANADQGPAWSFEAREFTRTSLIKKKVGLEMDVRKIIVKEEEKKEIVINAGTVFLGDKPFGADLLERGLAELNIVRGSEDVSSALKDYTYASERAQKNKRGLFGKKPMRRTFWDYSKPENKKKLKAESNLEPGDTLLKAVVERCMSASRLKLRLDSEGCFVIFVLNSVKSIRGNKNMSSLEKWFEAGQALATDLIAQRDVLIQVENIDSKGNVHGSLFLGKKNFAVKVLREGVTYLDTTYGRCRYHSKMAEAQDQARANKAGFWQDKSVVMTLNLGLEEEEEEEEDEPGAEGDLAETKAPRKKAKSKEFQAEISECESADLFYMQRAGSAKLKALAKIIQDKHRKCSMLEEPVTLKTLCLGYFEEEFHRCRIVSHAGKGKYKVFFIDWGNYDYVNVSNLKICPKKAMNILPQARAVSLAHIRVPSQNQQFGRSAIDWIQGNLMGKRVSVCQLTKYKGVASVEIYLKSKESVKQSLNYRMCVEGLALPDLDDPAVGEDPLWQEAYKLAVQVNPELVQVFNEEY